MADYQGHFNVLVLSSLSAASELEKKLFSAKL